MSKFSILLIFLSVGMSAAAQILLKYGMNSVTVQRALEDGFSSKTVWLVGTNIGVISGLFVYFASALVWLIVLAKVDVSLAYPFVSIGFLLTALMGHLLFGEIITLPRLLGILCVCVGVAFLARSS